MELFYFHYKKSSTVFQSLIAAFIFSGVSGFTSLMEVKVFNLIFHFFKILPRSFKVFLILSFLIFYIYYLEFILSRHQFFMLFSTPLILQSYKFLSLYVKYKIHVVNTMLSYRCVDYEHCFFPANWKICMRK